MVLNRLRQGVTFRRPNKRETPPFPEPDRKNPNPNICTWALGKGLSGGGTAQLLGPCFCTGILRPFRKGRRVDKVINVLTCLCFIFLFDSSYERHWKKSYIFLLSPPPTSILKFFKPMKSWKNSLIHPLSRFTNYYFVFVICVCV